VHSSCRICRKKHRNVGVIRNLETRPRLRTRRSRKRIRRSAARRRESISVWARRNGAIVAVVIKVQRLAGRRATALRKQRRRSPEHKGTEQETNFHMVTRQSEPPRSVDLVYPNTDCCIWHKVLPGGRKVPSSSSHFSSPSYVIAPSCIKRDQDFFNFKFCRFLGALVAIAGLVGMTYLSPAMLRISPAALE